MPRFGFKKMYFLLFPAFLFVVHFTFVNAINKKTEFTTATKNAVTAKTLFKDEKNVATAIVAKNTFASLYDSLKLNTLGLSQQAFDLATKGLNYLVETGKIANTKIISIIDFTLSSNKKRLFVIDLNNYKILFNTYVAHGVNSGKEYASEFSNSPESNKSSLGFYETAEPYIGKNGYSLHLVGLEKGINDNADSRSIVIHGANYVSQDLINAQGYIGRSWGCPAVPENLHKPIINKIKNGTCLFIYSSNKKYFNHSKILKKATETMDDNS